MSDQETMQRLMLQYEAALAQALSEYKKRTFCEICKKRRMCKPRPTGMLVAVAMWCCNECWSYATEGGAA